MTIKNFRNFLTANFIEKVSKIFNSQFYAVEIFFTAEFIAKKIRKFFTVNFIEKNFEFFSENPKKTFFFLKKGGAKKNIFQIFIKKKQKLLQ